MALSMMTISIMAISVIAYSLMGLLETICINDTQNNGNYHKGARHIGIHRSSILAMGLIATLGIKDTE